MSRILIVEDNEDEREGLRDLLELDGHTVKTCVSASDAHETFAHFHPDAALIDIGLPDSHGVELAFRLKQQQPGLFVVIVSGYLKKWDTADIRDCGANLVLEKPYDINELRNSFHRTKPDEALAGDDA